MRRRGWARGSRMVLLVGSLTLLLTGCSVQDAEKKMRFGWPTGVTKQADQMRTLWTWSAFTALVIGVAVWAMIFWAIIRYRKKSDELPRQTKYNLPLEIAYSIIPFIIIGGLFYRTVVVEDYVNKLDKNPDVLIQVDAFKWNWQFEYRTYKDATGTVQTAAYQGLTDPSDPQQKAPYYISTVGSDSEIPVLVVPKGKKVQIIEHSDDVIHSFWVPEFLFKRDVIPYGTLSSERDNRFQFEATSEGAFVGRCAELCGTYHSQMNFEVRVVDSATFLKYMNALTKIGPNDPARQSKALVAAGLPPRSTSTYPFNTDRTNNSASQNKGS